MSAGILGVDVPSAVTRGQIFARAAAATGETDRFSQGQYYRQQIRALVQQVFGPNSLPVRQLVMAAADNEIDMYSIAMSIAASLAETSGQDVVMLASREVEAERGTVNPKRPPGGGSPDRTPLRQLAARIGGDVWWLPIRENAIGTIQRLLREVRTEFEYSILLCPSSGQSAEALAMAQLTDGLILVLSAQHTRRVVARRIMQSLDAARVRVLGAVLADREFPIPETIYRRL